MEPVAGPWTSSKAVVSIGRRVSLLVAMLTTTAQSSAKSASVLMLVPGATPVSASDARYTMNRSRILTGDPAAVADFVLIGENRDVPPPPLPQPASAAAPRTRARVPGRRSAC